MNFNGPPASVVAPRPAPAGEKAERRAPTRVRSGDEPVSRADRELQGWIDLELEFYVKGIINDDDYRQLRRNLFNIARAERRRRGNRVSRRTGPRR